MKLIKVLVLLFVAAAFISVGAQILDYWLGLAYYPLVPSLLIGLIHITLMLAIGWVFLLTLNYKVS